MLSVTTVSLAATKAAGCAFALSVVTVSFSATNAAGADFVESVVTVSFIATHANMAVNLALVLSVVTVSLEMRAANDFWQPCAGQFFVVSVFTVSFATMLPCAKALPILIAIKAVANNFFIMLSVLFNCLTVLYCHTALMEVSSQGLMMDRVAGVHYNVGVFTNLSPDHIGPGEHKTFEEYRSWKGQLFKRCDVGVVNIDDENTEALLEGHTCRLVTYGRAEQADYRETGFELLRTHDFLGVKFHVTGKDEMDVKVNMPGEFSVYNALAALAVGKVLGLPDQAIHDGLGKCVVKGRVELVPISKKFTILLDYAHNEVSTESLLTTLRAYKPHRLVVVFGCGGNRSKLRRYGMGEICAKMADFSILTEDNNRFEKVEDILADIRVGMNKGNPDAKFVEIPDRLDALHYAVDHAQEGDLIAVIGKGHETYRDREGVKTPFLERELLEEYAQQIGLE